MVPYSPLCLILASLFGTAPQPQDFTAERLIALAQTSLDDSVAVRRCFVACGFKAVHPEKPQPGMYFARGDERLGWILREVDVFSNRKHRCISYSDSGSRATEAFWKALTQDGYQVAPGSCSRYATYYRQGFRAGVKGWGDAAVTLYEEDPSAEPVCYTAPRHP
ncbi:hypothetical protein [Flaviaesturariibacter terrae]